MALQELKDDIDNAITEELADLIEYPRRRSDAIEEIVEAHVPDRNAELAELLTEDHSFAKVQDSAMLSENPTVWDIIQMSVREFLSGYAHGEAKRQIDDFKDIKLDLEIEGFQFGMVSHKLKSSGDRHYIYRDLDDEELTDAEKEGDCSRSIDPEHKAPYHNELLIKAWFANEVDAVKWLEANLEEVQEKLK